MNFSDFGFEEEAEDDSEESELENEEEFKKDNDVEESDVEMSSDEIVQELIIDDNFEKQKILETISKKVIPRLRQSLQPAVCFFF